MNKTSFLVKVEVAGDYSDFDLQEAFLVNINERLTKGITLTSASLVAGGVDSNDCPIQVSTDLALRAIFQRDRK